MSENVAGYCSSYLLSNPSFPVWKSKGEGNLVTLEMKAGHQLDVF
jgi:hypothetical protein